jgi:tetratricopeptide (TPR) repeat protein
VNKRWLLPLGIALALGLVFLTGASRERRADDLLREGIAAFRAGDYTRAGALLERAEVFSTEPRRVVFWLAMARYRQVEDGGPLELLREAEQLFRCGAEVNDLRPAALCGLGNCLLLRGEGRSPADLKGAISAFARCLREPNLPEELRVVAEYNLQRARLVLAQFQEKDNPDEPANGSDPPEERNPPGSGQQPDEPGRRGMQGSDDPRMGEARLQPTPGEVPQPSGERPQAGAGKLPPVPDQGEPLPLDPRDAAEHIRRAAQRIVEERRAFRATRIKPPKAGIRNW